MTVSSASNDTRYSGNSVVTAFSTVFPFFAAASLIVFTLDASGNKTPLALTTDYSVTGGAGLVGAVTTLVAPATGTTLVIQRAEPYTQLTDLQKGDPLDAAVLELTYDKLEMQIQQVLTKTLTAIQATPGFDPNVTSPWTLPAPIAGQFLQANAGGTGWQNAAFSTLVGIVITFNSLADKDLFVYNAGGLTWKNATLPSVLAGLLTTRGDVATVGASGVKRLGLGSAGQVLTSDGTDVGWGAGPVSAKLWGQVVAWPGPIIPATWGECDGTAISSSTYPNAFAALVKSGTATMTIATPGVVTWTAHGLKNGFPVKFTTTGALPTGLTAGTTYYLINKATNTFQVAATPGGSAINTSGSQSGTHTAICAPWGCANDLSTFNKPDLNGRDWIGLDNGAGRVTVGGSGINGTTPGSAGGVENVTLSSSQIPSVGVSGSTSGFVVSGNSISVQSPGDAGATAITSLNTGGGSVSGSTSSSSGPHTNMPPSGVGYWIIQLDV